MIDRLSLAACVSTFHSPSEALRELRNGGLSALGGLYAALAPHQQEEGLRLAGELHDRGFDVAFLGEDEYPPRLLDLRRPPPLLFLAGDRSLLTEPAVGMCGSRHASEAGLRAAQACGSAVARSQLVVISGNAKGVDTAAHSAALDAGGRTILVLAEGPLRYRPRHDVEARVGEGDVLVMSQFAPRSSWNVGNAMTRNGLIAALGEALVVIAAGADGGTLDAGQQGLAIGRPVIALEFETGPTPPGNKILHRQGAIPVRSARLLTALLRQVRESWPGEPQLSLPFALDA